MEKQVIKCEFENQFPMVKIFEVDSLCYAYDGKSGLLAEITSDEITQIYNYSLRPNAVNLTNYLKGLFRDDVFLPGPLIRITPKQEELDEIISFHSEEVIPRTLMLEITEKCNLNCSYCSFAKEDGFNNRKHSRKNMTDEIAYKAIDYYYSRYINAITKSPIERKSEIMTQNPPMLQWWGGEPFAAFDLIVKTKSYFESLDWESYGISKKNIVYGLTSNLTLLNDDILSFIAQNNVKLKVSLDGDEESHNKNRVFPNGEGSFHITLKNLNTIIRKYPYYARYNVGIQSVLADNIDIFRSQEFIKAHFKLNTPSTELIMCSVSPQRKKNTFLSEIQFTKMTLEESIRLFKTEIDKIASNSHDKVEKLLKHNKQLYIDLKKIISIEKLLNFDFPKGSSHISKMFSCPLGADVIFIAVDGKFHCCAKTDYSFSFGDIETGIDKEKLKYIYTSYHKKVEEQCRSCWAFNFCNICPALVGSENQFLLPQKRECDQIRKNSLLQLAKYITLIEKYEPLYSQIKSLSKKS